MKINPNAVRTKLTVWMVPGLEQTLDDLHDKYADRVVEIDRERGRLKLTEQTWEH